MSEHVVPVRVYAAVFAALLVLTAVTTVVAYADLGLLNVVIMLTIAVVKATLVVLYFMHVRYASRLTWLVLASGFGWLAVLVVITTGDMVIRILTPSPLTPIARPAPGAFQDVPPPAASAPVAPR